MEELKDGFAGETAVKIKKTTKTSVICDLIEIVVTAVIVVLLVFTFFGRIAVVDGTSMTNMLHHADKLIISNLFYKPAQGDIIVCQTPFFGFEEPIVKRVIAVGGQTVRIDSENCKVYVDGKALSEDYVRKDDGGIMSDLSFYLTDSDGAYTVPEGCVFCMGDNRNVGGSWDSRDGRVGPIDVRYISGRVLCRLTPGFRFF
ncbi:MAG: signal peptidase I [Firmicutes bacterium]|nr:signal peptidase I [Candidatus Colimorpha enterica]